MLKQLLYVLIVLLCSGIVLAASLTGDCVFTADACADGSSIVFYAGAASNTHLFHTSSDVNVCCPGTGLGYFTSVDCTAAKATFIGDDSDAGGTHVSATIAGDYDTPVCITSTLADITACTYSDSVCDNDNGYYCVARVDAATNSHISNCGDANFGTRVCCKVTVACGGEEDECQVTNDCCNPDANYCSFGDLINPGYPLSPGHCCPDETHWDPFQQECTETTQCGFGGEFACQIDPGENWENFIEWARNDACVNPQTAAACCSGVDVYGEGGNYEVPYVIYEG